MRLTAITLMVLSLCFACRESHNGAALTASPQSRLVLGRPATFVGPEITPEEAAILKGSFGARRQAAWKMLATVLADVTIHPRQLSPNAPDSLTVPAFQTWYTKEDFDRLFRKMFGSLTLDERHQRATFTDEQWNMAEEWNVNQVRTLASWDDERLRAFGESIADEQAAHGLSGLTRTMYSSETAKHLIMNYKSEKACTDDPNVPGTADANGVNRSSCYGAELPSNAAIVKSSWRRSDFGLTMPLFDTSADAMKKRLTNPDLSWETPDREMKPDPTKMLSMVTEQGAHFHLAGLHLTTKRLRDWMWITMWYSDTPNSDFGEDRPAELNDPASPWRNYKMCVVVAFDETAKVDADFAAQFPSLSEALSAVNDNTNGASWCSNPYLEKGRQNQQTNCIGCHQHAGAATDPDKLLSDPVVFPNAGRNRQRGTFPADYIWSINKGPELLGGLISDRMQYFDTMSQP